MSRSGSDVRHLGEPKQTDGEIAKGRQSLRAVALADLAAVLIVGHIPHVMTSVLDDPLATIELEYPFWPRIFSAETGDADTHLLDAPAAFDNLSHKVGGDALDEKGLAHMGKVEVVVQFWSGPDLAHLDASMTTVNGFVFRGGKLPYRKLAPGRPARVRLRAFRSQRSTGYPAAASADCPWQ
jgi:hypothetical protein